MNIGFIFPSSEYLHDPFRGDPHTHFQILTVLESHFGNKHNFSLIDLRGIKKEFAFLHIPECDVYLHSVYTLDFNEQVSIVDSLRKVYPKAKHIAGGPHVVVFQDECLKVFDSIIVGDGEDCIVQAINDLMCLKLKKTYRQGEDININLYPYPSRKYLPKATVVRRGLMTLKDKKYSDLLSCTVIFSRGCPGKCAFCAMPQTEIFNNGVRFRDSKLVEAEIEYLKSEYNMQGISLLDEITFPYSRKIAYSHLEAIGRTGIVWRGQSRVDNITPETAKLARESGCSAIGLGVESVSQTSLDIISKKVSVTKSKEAIYLLKKNGIECRIYLIVGLPGEPDDIVKQTWDFVKETEPDLVTLSLFTVRPGTEVYNNPGKFGIKSTSTEWDNTMHMYDRYKKEKPNITFEYEEKTAWGKGFDSDRIVNNYLELQSRLKEYGFNSAIHPLTSP